MKNNITEIISDSHAVPEHILKIKDILANTPFTDDEFLILVAGKKDAKGKGYDMNSMYVLPTSSMHTVAEAFFAELMMMERKFKKGNIVMSFLSVAQHIISRIEHEVHERYCTGEKGSGNQQGRPC